MGSPPRAHVHRFTRALLVALTAGCAPSVYETNAYDKEWDPRKHEYVIGVSDAVRIGVNHAPDLSGEGIVRPDGVITTVRSSRAGTRSRTSAWCRATPSSWTEAEPEVSRT
jgi:hypothetical protein